MIRCDLCQGRVRPPSRPWTIANDGGLSFYRTTSDGMALYEKWLTKFAKRLPVVHEVCALANSPGSGCASVRLMLSGPHIVALNLDIRLRHQQRRN